MWQFCDRGRPRPYVRTRYYFKPSGTTMTFWMQSADRSRGKAVDFFTYLFFFSFFSFCTDEAFALAETIFSGRSQAIFSGIKVPEKAHNQKQTFVDYLSPTGHEKLGVIEENMYSLSCEVRFLTSFLCTQNVCKVPWENVFQMKTVKLIILLFFYSFPLFPMSILRKFEVPFKSINILTFLLQTPELSQPVNACWKSVR